MGKNLALLQQEAKDIARQYFLRDDTEYGCAESTYITLKTIYRLPNPQDSSVAMALNGGVAYSGNICGAITGAALAVGELAQQRTGDHQKAKRVARAAIQRLQSEFIQRFSSDQCEKLIGYKLSIGSEHERFIASGIWRTICMKQIEFVVAHLAFLEDERTWKEFVDSIA